MHWVGTIIAIMAGSLILAAAAWSQDDQAMMDKSQGGIELSATADLEMCAPDRIAVGGYDLVSYRQADGPVLGGETYSTEFDGLSYHFANHSNLNHFREDPHYYLPAYSGFCAITLALGRLTCPEYTNFKIEDDRLYLFEVTGFTNGRTLWNSDASRFRQQADSNFSRLIELQ